MRYGNNEGKSGSEGPQRKIIRKRKKPDGAVEADQTNVKRLLNLDATPTQEINRAWQPANTTQVLLSQNDPVNDVVDWLTGQEIIGDGQQANISHVLLSQNELFYDLSEAGHCRSISGMQQDDICGFPTDGHAGK